MNEDTAEESGEEQDKTRTNQYKGEPVSTSKREKLVQENGCFWREVALGGRRTAKVWCTDKCHNDLSVW